MNRLRRRMAEAAFDRELRARLDHAIEHTLAARTARMVERPDWEQLRDAVATARREQLARHDELLRTFGSRARAHGARVHRARDAREARLLLTSLVGRPAGPLIKSKSMVTEEIGLRRHLARRGVEVVETDLGEYIVQLLGGLPAHIVAPAIDLSAADIARAFRERLGLTLPEPADPRTISLAARAWLRRSFVGGALGMVGANFLTAEEGAVVVCTNEGNGGLCASLPPRLIAVSAIDKLWPDLPSIRPALLTLSSSSTGQRQTCYVRALRGPRGEGEADGPEGLDIVLVDNGRSALLAEPKLREALACIRCGACMYACPVYRRTGGQAYGWVYPGPIGIVLASFLGAPEGARSLDACSLCGACAEVCPARIPLPDLILAARARRASGCSAARRLRSGAGAILGSPRRFAALAGLARRSLANGTAYIAPPARLWLEGRELPDAPEQTFSQMWRGERPGPSGAGVPAGERAGSTARTASLASDAAPPKDVGQRAQAAPPSLSAFLERCRFHLSVGGEMRGSCEIVASLQETRDRVAMLLRGRSWLAWATELCDAVTEGLPGHGQRSREEPPEAAVVEACALCAETGGFALESAPGRARSDALLPPLQVVLADADSLVGGLEEALAFTARRHASEVVWVCGPSRTADVEKTVVSPAHGPEEVHVIILAPMYRPE